jgi:hypothetical protein
MGQVITLLPLMDRTIIVQPEANNFLNAVASATPQALYVKAKQAYDNKLAIWNTSQTDVKNAKDALDAVEAYYKPYEAPINAGDYNNAIAKIMTNEGYGDPFYDGKRQQDFRKYGIPQENLRQLTAECTNLAGEGWEYIYSTAGQQTGSFFTQGHRKCQEAIVKKWLKEAQKRKDFFKGVYDAAVSAEGTAKRNAETAKAELDKAIAAEEKASGQRILEKQTDPEYIRLKNESEKIRLEAEAKKAKMRTVLLLGLGAFAVVAAVLVLRKK